MSTVLIEERTRNVIDLNKLIAEVKAAIPKVEGMVKEGDDLLKFQISEALTGSEDQQLTDLVTDFVEGDPDAGVPYINLIAKEEAQKKHFHNINYKLEVDSNAYTMHRRNTFFQGELQKVEWSTDAAHTQRVVDVDITYNRDSIGNALDRVTIRTWYTKDGTALAETKPKYKAYDETASQHEGVSRRKNLYLYVRFRTLNMMLETISDTALNIQQLGVGFLAAHEVEFASFVNNSDPTILTTVTNATDAWLNNMPASLGGSTRIRDWILGELNIWGI